MEARPSVPADRDTREILTPGDDTIEEHVDNEDCDDWINTGVTILLEQCWCYYTIGPMQCYYTIGPMQVLIYYWTNAGVTPELRTPAPARL